jgi:hypothetical protein
MSQMHLVAFVHRAELIITDGDLDAPGGAVTSALCGHWEHDGPCKWPHHTELHDGVARTIVVAGPSEEDDVRARIEEAYLSRPDAWSVTAQGPDALQPEEEALAARLKRSTFD